MGEKIKGFLAEKRYGFYVTLCGLAMSVVAAIVYAVQYHAYVNFMSWASFWMFLAGSVLGVVLLVLRRYNWVAGIVGVGDLLGMLFFIRNIFPYVSNVLNGVDVASFSSNFILSVVFIAIAVIITAVAIFLPQVKEKDVSTKGAE